MPTKLFGTVRPKIFDGKTWYPLICIKFFYTPNFLKHWRDAHEIFRHCETKSFRCKNVIPPNMHKIFLYPKFSETLKGCPRNFSVLWDKKNPQNRDAPLLCMKIFDKRYFLKHQSVLQWNISVQWDKNFDGKSWCPPPPLIHKIFFSTRNFLKHRMVPWRSFFCPVRWKKFRQNREASPSFAWNFPIPEFCRNTGGFSYELYRHCETKIFQRSLVIFPSYA